jgi:hypothetical protein
MRKLTKIVLIANLCFWVYFWVAFFLAAQPYDPRPLGHLPLGPCSIGGRAIGLTTPSLSYPFMQAALWIQFPSFLIASLGQRALSNDLLFFAGISIGGYKLLVTMLLSFLQWYLISWVWQKVQQGWSGHHPREHTDAISAPRD